MSEELQALSTHGLVPPDKQSPGRPPKMEWLPISKLRIDPSYQRPVIARGKHTIATIVQQFQWARFSPLIVSPVPGKGHYTIIDGQHRASAALICGYSQVPCQIIDARPDEAASIFAAVNGTVTPMSILSLYKASLIAREAWALEVRQATEAAGIEALTYPVSKSQRKPLQTLAIGTLRKQIMRHGVAVVSACLKVEARKKDACMPGYFNSIAIAQAVERRADRDVAAVRHIAGPASGNPVRLREHVIELRRRGYARPAIAAATGLKYSEIEDMLNGAK